jgi:hypothetical protein
MMGEQTKCKQYWFALVSKACPEKTSRANLLFNFLLVYSKKFSKNSKIAFCTWWWLFFLFTIGRNRTWFLMFAPDLVAIDNHQ